MSPVFNIGIIGSGPGGHTAAFQASRAGAKVVLFEKSLLGGVCLNWGCIPTKTYLENLKVLKKAASILGNDSACTLSLEALRAKKEKVVGNQRKGLEFLFKQQGIEIVRGHASLQDTRTIEVNEGGVVRTFNCNHVIIASGSSPYEAPFLPVDGKKIITSDSLFSLTEVPEKVLIVGAGAIGCEFAQILHNLGAEVFLVECMPRILPDNDEEITKVLESHMTREGIHIFTGTGLEKVEESNGRTVVVLQNGKKIEVNLVISALGRRANSKDLGLEHAGIQVSENRINVNEYLQTTVKTIYAIGDCVAGPMLAHKASYDASVAVNNILSVNKETVQYSFIPKCVFTSPEISSIGLNQKEAESVTEIHVGKYQFAANGKAQAAGEIRGFVKIIARKDNGEILGCHIVGPQATELISVCSVAVRNKLKASDVAAAVFAHPTLSEAVKGAAENVEVFNG